MRQESEFIFCVSYICFRGHVTPPTDKQERRMNLTSELSGWVTTHSLRRLRRHSQVSLWWSVFSPWSIFPDWQPGWMNEWRRRRRETRSRAFSENRPVATCRLSLLQCVLVFFSAWQRSNYKKFHRLLMLTVLTAPGNSSLPHTEANSSLPHTEAADAAAPPVSAVANRGQDPWTTRSSKKCCTSHSAMAVMYCCHFQGS